MIEDVAVGHQRVAGRNRTEFYKLLSRHHLDAAQFRGDGEDAPRLPVMAATSEKKLVLSAKKGDVAAIKENLDAGIAVDSKDAGGSTALYWATFKGHDAAVNQLLQAKADPNARNGEEHTVLIEAVLQTQLTAAKYLIAWGADLSLTLVDEDDGPQTALDLAKENEAEELVTLLESVATAEGLAKLKAEMLPSTASTEPKDGPPAAKEGG